MPLIKRSLGYYVPKSYNKEDAQFQEDKNISFPVITFDKKRNKWKVLLTVADSGGYDVQLLIVYFDTLEDFYNIMNPKTEFDDDSCIVCGTKGITNTIDGEEQEDELKCPKCWLVW